MNEFKLDGRVLKTPQIEHIGACSYCVLYLNVYPQYEQINKATNVKIYCYNKVAEDICTELKEGDRCLIKGHIEGFMGDVDADGTNKLMLIVDGYNKFAKEK